MPNSSSLYRSTAAQACVPFNLGLVLIVNSLTDNAGITQERSTFVTVLAWIFIALTGFTTLITGLQLVSLSFRTTPLQISEISLKP